MTILRSKTRPVRMLVVLAVAGSMLSACSPSPAPSPTPTAAFASEDEAFAAAEEVYRAYNEAGNARRAGKSEPDPQDYLIGTALEGDIKALNQLREVDIHLEGNVEVTSMDLLESNLADNPPHLTAMVCLDLTNTRVLDDSGSDVTPHDRDLLLAQQVSLILVSDRLLISDEESAWAAQC